MFARLFGAARSVLYYKYWRIFLLGGFAKMKTYRIGICGYGNLGRGVELALRQQPDMSLAAVFTRRMFRCCRSPTRRPTPRTSTS